MANKYLEHIEKRAFWPALLAAGGEALEGLAGRFLASKAVGTAVKAVTNHPTAAAGGAGLVGGAALGRMSKPTQPPQSQA